MLSFLKFKKKDMNNKNSNVKCQMSNLLIILLFLLWKTLDTWVLYLAEKIIPYLGFFPYPRELFDFGLPQVTSALANFDGIHYLKIASRGYGQWEQAYFPLYPLLIKLFTFVLKNELIAGLIISNVAFLIGVVVILNGFDKLTAGSVKDPVKTKSRRNASLDSSVVPPLAGLPQNDTGWWFTIFLLTFPTSFFFGAVYTEGLFFLLLVLTLYFLKKERYWLVGLFAILASLTRLIGVFLVIPIALHWLSLSFRRKHKLRFARSFDSLRSLRMTVAAPFIGLGIYCLYLWQTTGDPFFFLSSQPVFGANRSTNIILLPQVIWRYFKIFITASHNFQYYISLFEFLVFSFVFTIVILSVTKNLAKRKYGLRPRSFVRLWRTQDDMKLGLDLFSLVNILLPTLTGTFSSIPRYALFSLSFFIFLTEIKNKWIKIGIIIMFLILHIVTLGFFGQGYFIS